MPVKICVNKNHTDLFQWSYIALIDACKVTKGQQMKGTTEALIILLLFVITIWCPHCHLWVHSQATKAAPAPRSLPEPTGQAPCPWPPATPLNPPHSPQFFSLETRSTEAGEELEPTLDTLHILPWLAQAFPEIGSRYYPIFYLNGELV